jgi:hypothetical protein
MGDRVRPSSKGRIDKDVAEEAARQCWGARELLIRMGFPSDQIGVKAGIPLGVAGGKRLEDRMLESCVELRLLLAKGDGVAPAIFSVTCGPVPSVALFVEAVRRRVAGIAAGVFSERDLLRAYKVTTAYGARFEIVAALRAKGFPVPATWELDVDPSASGPTA